MAEFDANEGFYLSVLNFWNWDGAVGKQLPPSRLMKAFGVPGLDLAAAAEWGRAHGFDIGDVDGDGSVFKEPDTYLVRWPLEGATSEDYTVRALIALRVRMPGLAKRELTWGLHQLTMELEAAKAGV